MDSPDSGIVLIVDDNITYLSVLSKILESAGLIVRVAIDGESAIAQVEDNPPGLILLDIQMPGIGGFETCRRLKTQNHLQDIPIIFMTAIADTEQKIEGLSLGAVDYITKPFQTEELLARIRVHLRLHWRTQKVMEQANSLRHTNLQLQRLANLDGLTGVANRRRFDEYLKEQWQCLTPKNAPLSLIICDIDYFKSYNDYYGHQAGDHCLKQVAYALRSAVKRSVDLVCRYGGEEFAIIMPNTNLQGAVKVAEEIALAIKKLKIFHAQSQVSEYVTISLGISSQIPTQASRADWAIANADHSLYQAKEQGRDRHCIYKCN